MKVSTKEKIKVTGNSVIDALITVSSIVNSGSNKQEEYFSSRYGINLDNQKIILLTGHRRESIGKGFENIFHAIKHGTRSFHLRDGMIEHAYERFFCYASHRLGLQIKFIS